MSRRSAASSQKNWQENGQIALDAVTGRPLTQHQVIALTRALGFSHPLQVEWTEAAERTLFCLIAVFGTRWSVFRSLPVFASSNKSDNDLKASYRRLWRHAIVQPA